MSRGGGPGCGPCREGGSAAMAGCARAAGDAVLLVRWRRSRFSGHRSARKRRAERSDSDPLRPRCLRGPGEAGRRVVGRNPRRFRRTPVFGPEPSRSTSRDALLYEISQPYHGSLAVSMPSRHRARLRERTIGSPLERPSGRPPVAIPWRIGEPRPSVPACFIGIRSWAGLRFGRLSGGAGMTKAIR